MIGGVRPLKRKFRIK